MRFLRIALDWMMAVEMGSKLRIKATFFDTFNPVAVSPQATAFTV